MIDLDELERKRAAAEKQLAQREAGGVYLYESDVDAYTNALKESAPELIAMARRYQWLRNEAWNTLRAAPAVCMVDGAGSPFLCRETRYVEPILEGGSLDEAIDAAMQEQKT